MNQFFQEQQINHENPILGHLSILCRTTLSGVLSFYNGQTQVLDIQHCFICLLLYQGIIRGNTSH
jgi:hypothetical protein